MEIRAENQSEIEDANRLCVLAGDFFLAAASTQLSELENQLIVNQISKGIGDMSTGRVFSGSDVDQWIQARFRKHIRSELYMSQKSQNHTDFRS